MQGDLARACIQGDRGVWETLVRIHGGLVPAVICRCRFDGDQADNLFHAVWLAAWEQLATAPRDAGVAGWLATLAAREVTRALQRAGTSQLASDDGREVAGA